MPTSAVKGLKFRDNSSKQVIVSNPFLKTPSGITKEGDIQFFPEKGVGVTRSWDNKNGDFKRGY